MLPSEAVIMTLTFSDDWRWGEIDPGNEGVDNLDPTSDTLRRGVTTFEWSITGLGL